MFRVIDAGFFTTIQDTGRFGYRDIGVPVSGAMDAIAANIANSLLENKRDDAVLEITMTGPTLEFEEPTFIALSGSEMSASINGREIKNNEVHKIETGDVLSFGKMENGFRSYLAVKGGLKTKEVLDSRSYFKTLTKINRLKAEDEISYDSTMDFDAKISHIKTEPYYKEHKLKVYPGPEFELLEKKYRDQIFATNFTIAKEYNRMAYQLEEIISAPRIPMITSANIPGTVQLTPGGKLIILMRDGQTTGGYPRILQLSETSISILSQKRFGDSISFARI